MNNLIDKMASKLKPFSLQEQHYENRTTGSQKYLAEQEDNQETYEAIDNKSINKAKTGNKYSVFGKSTKESSNTAVAGTIGSQKCLTEEEDSQETYEEIDNINIKQTKPGNKYSVFGKSTIESSNTAVAGVQETSFEQKECPVPETNSTILPQRFSAIRKWKILSIISCIVIIALTVALVTVLILMFSSKVSPCEGLACLHMGTCSTAGDKAICNCQTGYYGDRCQYDPCSGSPCLNQGTCTPRCDRFDCSCRNGYYGDRCENDPCTRSPCLNQGTCTSHGDRFECSCRNGYFGDRCENYICSSSPCLNQGTCTPRVDRYGCSCRNEYYGERCENEGSFVKSIQSPGFPSSYPHSLDRTWNTDVGSGYVAVLRFKTFSTEYVTVYNGPSTSSKILCKWCGKMVPTEMRASGQHVTVKMTTDGSGTYTGFAADVYKTKT